MKKLSIVQLDDGMCIAQDIGDGQGNVVVERGTEVNSEIISILIDVGTHEILVFDNEDEIREARKKDRLRKIFQKYRVDNVEDAIKAIETEVEERFFKVRKNKIMRELMEHIIQDKIYSSGLKD